MKRYNIAIIGSGSTYTPELVDGLIQYRDSLPVASLRLMDIDERKRTVVGELSRRILTAADMDCEVVLTDDLDTALAGADFVLTQLRVGKLPARVLDETIPLKYNMIGQETTGIGGFFKALRTIPVILNIARRMEVLCPDAFMVNFTNPSGIVTQAVLAQTKIRAMGLCNNPINMFANLKERLGTDNIRAQYVGLNHLSWITRVEADGADVTGRILSEGMNAHTPKNIKASGFSPECIAAAGGMPCAYLEYFYNRNKKLEEQQAAEKCRGQLCIEIEEKLLVDYADPALNTKPAGLDQRGGARYSMAAISLINAIANDLGEEHVVNVMNAGALDFMEADDVVEVACRVDKNGATPLAVKDFDNRHVTAMMRTLKAYERHTVNAAVAGDELEAMRALMVNPLVGDFENGRACFEELKQAHKAYLPQFFGGEG